MPVTITDTGGTTTTTTIPTGYSIPTPVEEFRWEAGVLKWKKSTEDIMTGGSYVIQYAITTTPIEADWIALTTVTQTSITSTTGTYRDVTGAAARKYRIKKLTSSAYGSQSSIYVSIGVYWTASTDKCYVMIYLREIDYDFVDNAQIKVVLNVTSSITYAVHKNKTIIPIREVSKKVEANSGLLIIPLIPSADMTATGYSSINYNFTIVYNNENKISFTNKIVPQSSSAFLTDLATGS